MIRLKSSTSLMRPIVRTPNSAAPETKLPPGISTFWRCDGVAHLVDGQAVRVQAIRIEQELDLAPALAVQLNRADVLQGFEHLLDLNVGDFGQLLLRAGTVHLERENRLRVRILFLNVGRPGVSRKAVDNGGDLVADVLGGRFDVALEREVDGDARVALIGRGAQLVDAADGVDGLLDALRDLGLDFLGAGARRFTLTKPGRGRSSASGRGRVLRRRRPRAPRAPPRA